MNRRRLELFKHKNPVVVGFSGFCSRGVGGPPVRCTFYLSIQLFFPSVCTASADLSGGMPAVKIGCHGIHDHKFCFGAKMWDILQPCRYRLLSIDSSNAGIGGVRFWEGGGSSFTILRSQTKRLSNQILGQRFKLNTQKMRFKYANWQYRSMAVPWRQTQKRVCCKVGDFLRQLSDS